MTLLIIGLVLFLGVHSISIVAPAWRNGMAVKLGPWPWRAIYGVLSIIGFVLIVKGYALARLDPTILYTPPVWLRHVSWLLMVPVFPLLLAAYLPGRIKTATKHPMLAAVKIWALAHLLVNGTVADVLLFGGFLAWAVVDRISLKRRVQQPMVAAPASKLNDVIAVVVGLGLYAWFIMGGHIKLIGVSPM